MTTHKTIWSTLCPDPHEATDVVDGSAGFFLSDDRLLFVESGSVNLFIGSFDKKTGAPAGNHLFVAGFDAGMVLFPVPVQLEKDDTVYRLIAAPLPCSQLRQSRLSWLQAIQSDEEAQRQFEHFTTLLLTPFAQEMPPVKTRVLTHSDLEKKRDFTFPAQTTFRPGQGLLWIKLNDGFCILNGDEEQALLTPESEFPVSAQMWLQSMDTVSISCRTTAEWLADAALETSREKLLQQYMRAVLIAVIYNNQRRQRRQTQLLKHEKDSKMAVMQRLRNMMQGQVRSTSDDGGPTIESPLVAVVRRVACACGMDIELPVDTSDHAPGDMRTLLRLLEQSNLFYRKIKLTDTWWEKEGMPVVAFRKEDGQPVGLFYEHGQFLLFDPVASTTVPLDEILAAELNAIAVSVYTRLPARPLGWRDVLPVVFLRLRTDMRAVFIIGLIGGLIAMIPSRITSSLFNTIIPSADYFQLFQIGVILLSAALTGALFEFARATLMLRIKTRSSYQLQAAIWGRLLNLPVGFFGNYAAGDLAQRVMGVDAIRSMLTDNVSQAAMSLIFALPNLALMLYYSRLLTVIGLLAILIYIALLMGISYVNYRNQHHEFKCDGELSGFALQAITGIAKIRMSISENRAFVRWANLFAEKIRWKSRSIDNMNVLAVIGALFSPIITGVFFLIIGSKWKDTQLNTGNYLAFNAAFSALATAFTGFAAIVPSILASGALYKRLKPVMEAVPEITDGQKVADTLDGNVEIRNATYRYAPDLPPVLNDITIHARPGEFIAIVGPSGAGKSTIARLLLGFDTPESGGIYYGGMDMSTVNRRDLRKQIGTVLQGGGLIQASIYENIAGASGISLNDAWEAARQAGCADDIRAMPMGMHTAVHNGAVSGGQRQRLLISRALARNPRVIIFDEATSALDNETQAHVADSLDRLNATRIVIAHRLSTIIHADRIYVLDAGHIVQTGTFTELIKQPGLFQRLAQRQLL